MRRLVILSVLAALSCGTMVRAECTPPAPPAASERPGKPAQPERPRCADTRSCDAGEADRYKAKIYARNLQAYVDRLNAYVAAAGAYAKCEVTATNAS